MLQIRIKTSDQNITELRPNFCVSGVKRMGPTTMPASAAETWVEVLVGGGLRRMREGGMYRVGHLDGRLVVGHCLGD